MQMKTERFEMRLDREILEQVDKWRANQDDFPSRAEAVRRLVDAGLAVSGKGAVRISDGEKLILAMLRDLYKHHKVDGEIDPEFVGETIWGGHYWGLEWKYTGLFHGHVDNPRVVSEVVDVLDMWSFIESGYAKLSKKDKARVEAEAEPFGKHVVFRGFDGNNESEHLSIARFLINDLDRFTSFKGRDLNSHMPMIDAYRRMLVIFEPVRRTLIGGELSASQIIELLKAQIHPSHRNE
jgi:Uncharacterized conserved protein